MDLTALKALLDKKYEKYHVNGFIQHDPVSIPHLYKKKQDVEIAAFITATISWGNRKSIISNSRLLFENMDHAPYDFIINHTDKDLQKFEHWCHRTFMFSDLMGFIAFLQHHYSSSKTLEDAFLINGKFTSVKEGITMLGNRMFNGNLDILSRTQKHVSSPEKGSACKRLNMFLRWMVRPAAGGVDFGLWKKIPKSALMMPLDVHVDRVARQLGMLQRKQSDWKSVEELTAFCRVMDKEDPVKYDYALFGMGLEQKNNAPGF